jgi:peroxiredoxin family protein
VKVKSKRKSNNAVLQCNEKIQLKISNRIGNFCFPIKAYYMISEKMKLADNHIISFLKVLINTLSVGMTACTLLLQIFDYQYFNHTYLNQNPIWTLDENSS